MERTDTECMNQSPAFRYDGKRSLRQTELTRNSNYKSYMFYTGVPSKLLEDKISDAELQKKKKKKIEFGDTQRFRNSN